MLERLGNVAFWIGLIVVAAAIILGWNVYQDAPAENKNLAASIIVIPGIVVFLVGWVIRYVISGR